MKRPVTVFFLLFITSIFAHAQVQTTEECVSTARARTLMTISNSEIQRLCEDNPFFVVDCAITQMQAAKLSGNLEKALNECRKNLSLIYWK